MILFRWLKQILTPPMIEIPGLLLVLISVGLQVFLEDELRDIRLHGELFKMDRKLGIIWSYTGAYAPKLAGESSNRSRSDYNDHTVNLNSEEFKLQPIRSQIDFSQNFRMILFSLGTIMIIIARHHEIKRVSRHQIPPA